MPSANMNPASQTLRKGYGALATRDDERLMSCLAEHVELSTLTGSYRGHDGVRQWIAEMDEAWSPWDLRIDDIKEFGDRVPIEVTLVGRSSINDMAMSARFWVVWEVQDERAILGTHYAEREQALRAAEAARRP
jgi:ketosteroid isomerase-like protein